MGAVLTFDNRTLQFGKVANIGMLATCVIWIEQFIGQMLGQHWEHVAEW